MDFSLENKFFHEEFVQAKHFDESKLQWTVDWFCLWLFFCGRFIKLALFKHTEWHFDNIIVIYCYEINLFLF